MKSVSAVLLFVVLLTNITTATNRIEYHNYEVYKITTKHKENLELLRNIDGSSDGIIFLDGIQSIGMETYAIVAPENRNNFIQTLNHNTIEYHLIEKNLQSRLDFIGNPLITRSFQDYNWKSYQTLERTYDWLKFLAKKYPENVEILIGGKTYEGRDIIGVKLSYKSGNKGVFIEGGIHAREWISPATVTYILNQLITNEDPNLRKTIESFDWYIFPHFNPDGYVYTYTTDRLWRKTRSVQGSCYGVDPNRNWAFHWNEVGTSTESCSEVFSGSHPFSEIETKSLSEFISSLNGKIHTYLSFHSYSQLLLFPYGHTKQHAPNHDDLQHIGDVAAKALEKRYGTKYVVGNVYEAIYPASGASVDWAYGGENISLSYTYELRPADGYIGFILPKEQIIPTGEETFDSVIALIEEAQKLGYYE